LGYITRSLGQDELYTAVHFVEVGSLWNTMTSIGAFNNHVGYSLMARFSQALLGHSEWALRLPALLLGLLAICSVFVFARLILPPIWALAATMLLSISPPHVIWSVSARGYSGLILCTIVSSYLYFKLLRHRNFLDGAVYVVVSVCGIYIHLYAAFVTLVQILLFLYLVKSPKATKQFDLPVIEFSFHILSRCFFVIVSMSILLYVPLVGSFLHDLVGRGRRSFIPYFPWFVLQELTASQSLPIILIFLAFSLIGYFYLRCAHPLETRYFTWLFIGPLLMMWMIRPFDLYTRFFIYWLPCYVLLFVAGAFSMWNAWFRSKRRAVIYLSRGVVVAASIAVLLNWSLNWNEYMAEEGYREASRAVTAGLDDSTAICAIGGARSVWKYYIHENIAMPLTLSDLRRLGFTHREVRCVYYEASWQSAEQTEIAQFLSRNGTFSKVGGVTFFVYREPGKPTSSNPSSAPTLTKSSS